MEYFKKENIQSITLQGDKLLIEYKNSATETKEIKEIKTQQIKSYLTKIGKNKLNLSDLEQESSDNGESPKKPVNYWPWIIGGVAILILLAIVAYLFLKNKESKNGQ